MEERFLEKQLGDKEQDRQENIRLAWILILLILTLMMAVLFEINTV
jgi:predicted nucleic acid-binding Zn ribbon protein